jgi:predicted hotdog family 3-hydroxylacyl-ACP dehydratase
VPEQAMLCLLDVCSVYQDTVLMCTHDCAHNGVVFLQACLHKAVQVRSVFYLSFMGLFAVARWADGIQSAG